jgi:oxygen-independent coproporphyrinogen-3 oxidase
MLNALRLVAGFATAEFESRTGLPIATVEAPLATATARGLLEAVPGGFRPTPQGFSFLNDLQALFLPRDG